VGFAITHGNAKAGKGVPGPGQAHWFYVVVEIQSCVQANQSDVEMPASMAVIITVLVNGVGHCNHLVLNFSGITGPSYHGAHNELTNSPYFDKITCVRAKPGAPVLFSDAMSGGEDVARIDNAPCTSGC